MDDTASFRRFNRFYTRFIGTLDEGLLNTRYTLAEARVLYEVATRTAPRAKEIAQALGLDAGYLSRLLGKLETDGVLKRKTSAEDARAAEIALTARGKSDFQKLDALSEQQAQGVMKSMTKAKRSRLVSSMGAIERILSGDGANRVCVLRPHRVGDMGWVVAREGAAYAEEFGWDETFEALVAKIVSEFVMNFDGSRERCWMAEVDGENMGHIFLVKHPERSDTAKLRLLFVERAARGIGLGQKLVAECLQFARSVGYRRVMLWTQSMLLPAHRIYERAGFRLVSEEPHHSFGVDLVGQTWELEL